MSDEILALPEVAQLLKVAEKTVYTMAQKGKLPATEPAARHTRCVASERPSGRGFTMSLGIAVSCEDLQIAAIAVVGGLTLVSADRAFRRFAGLSVADWTNAGRTR